MTAPVLTIAGLRAGFGPTTVLHGVDLEVGSGEVAALLGLNGAGKSVTLRVAAGLVPAWSGTVRLLDEDVTTVAAEARVGRGMAHVTQGRHVFPDLSVEENLRLGAYTLRRRDRRRYPGVLESVLERFPRLAERRRQLAGTMSGGEQAMLAVGRALMADPSVILVDEPSAGLAPAAADTLVDTLRNVHASGVSMLLVEQNVTFALELADTVHVMRQGSVVHSAPRGRLDQERLTAELGIGQLLKGTSP
jgi:branched-chain amino acid transport system ATP-binding protein